MPPKTTTKAAADKPVGKLAEKVADLPSDERVKDVTAVIPPPDSTLEGAAQKLAAEAPPATIPPPAARPSTIGFDLAQPGAETTAYIDVERLQDTAAEVCVRALHPIKHNGQLYGPGMPSGDELTVTPVQRDELAAIGAIEDPSL